jgi:TonB family protein
MQQEKNRTADYVLTEINMLEVIQEQKKEMQVERPKKAFDILKQLIPVRQQAKLAISDPAALKAQKIETGISRPKAISLENAAQGLKPGIKAIDLDAEIGMKKISALKETARIEPALNRSGLQASVSKLDLTAKNPREEYRPIIRADLQVGRQGLAAAAIKQPTPEIKVKKTPDKGIEIPAKQAILIQGEVAGRRILASKTPAYPRWAQEQGIETSVTLRFYVTPSGGVKNNVMVEKTSGYPELDAMAQEALLQFAFETLAISGDQSGIAMFRFVLEK